MATSSADALSVLKSSGRGGWLVKLSGIIDERFDPKAVSDGVSGTVVFDLDAVGRITSFGVREWFKGMNALHADYYCFVNVRPALVLQFNMVANFAVGGQLLSFYAPFHCESCSEEFEVLIDLRTQLAEVRAGRLNQVQCLNCSAMADLDELPDDYYAFVSTATDPTPPPLVAALLDGSAFGNATKTPFKLDKAVSAGLTALRMHGDLDRTVRLKRQADGLEGTVLIVAEGVTHVGPEGVAALAPLLTLSNAKVYLARVPVQLAAALADDPGALKRATVLSLWVHVTCTDCNSTAHLEVDGMLLVALSRGVPEKCPTCNHESLAVTNQHDLDQAVGVRLGSPTAEIVEYLGRDQRGPVRREAGSQGIPFGRYTLLRQIGTGGMAEVFVARQTAMAGFEKKIVVKRILPALSSDESFISMFLQEARVAARISHPNVVQIFDLGQVGAQYFIAMEYVKGWDLNAVLRLCLRLNSPMPVHLAVRVVADICSGLDAAHTCVGDDGQPMPIVHRDVSPHNVLLSSSGMVKLTDFGIAKAVDAGQLTPTTTLKGKITYMAPEQITPDLGPPDTRADLFPCGTMLYLCLTLEHIFRRESELSTLKAILHDPIPRVMDRRRDVPVEIQAIIEKALAKRPAERFQAAVQMRDALEAVLAKLGQPAGPQQLASWLRGLVTHAQAVGQLPPDVSVAAFTPTTAEIGHSSDDDPPTPVTRPGRLKGE